jgi:hypothetical protein
MVFRFSNILVQVMLCQGLLFVLRDFNFIFRFSKIPDLASGSCFRLCKCPIKCVFFARNSCFPKNVHFYENRDVVPGDEYFHAMMWWNENNRHHIICAILISELCMKSNNQAQSMKYKFKIRQGLWPKVEF